MGGSEADSIKGDARDERLRGPTHNHRHREKEFVRKQLMVEARDKCHETRQTYVDCAKGAHWRNIVQGCRIFC